MSKPENNDRSLGVVIDNHLNIYAVFNEDIVAHHMVQCWRTN